MKNKTIFIILIITLNEVLSIPIANKDCFTWELCDAIGCTDRYDCWLGHTVGDFGDCEDCRYPFHRGYNYECFSKKTHYLECKCLSHANPKGCHKNTTQYARISFESDYGIDISSKKIKKKINFLDLIKNSDFVSGIKNLCKVVDAAKDVMDFLDNPFKKIVQEATHNVVEELVKTIVRDTSLNKFDGIDDYISIGINFAIDLYFFNLRNLEVRQLDNSYFKKMFDLIDQINQRRGIASIKIKGLDEFYDSDYFGYDDFSAVKIEKNDLRYLNIFSNDEVEKILSDSKWINEEFLIIITTKSSNEELNKIFNYEKISIYAHDQEKLIKSNTNIDSTTSTSNDKTIKINYYLLSALFIAILF